MCGLCVKAEVAQTQPISAHLKKKKKTIMFSYYKQTDQWGENKLWRPEAGISRGIWHLPFMEEQT